WVDSIDDRAVFSRTLKVSPSDHDLKCLVAEFPSGTVFLQTNSNEALAIGVDRVTAIAIKGPRGTLELGKKSDVYVQFHKSMHDAVCTIFVCGSSGQKGSDVQTKHRSVKVSDNATSIQPSPARWTKPITKRLEPGKD